ncbi:MAG TPA: UDP-N-acetylmuramoyl-L-alanyl-D-glutamate--2,6-diaminopimelate ligase [Mycobacteriales bacterium]|nr:UDP-N-acetylmuramoyl-L-alanyl-D-glutamate--2,6-diaminopimelate ligase [Mycobacteriales bacterium]
MQLRPTSPAPRALAEVLGAVPGLTARGSLEGVLVSGCTHDSREVEAADLYAALPGEHTHGAGFVGQARQAGAVAVLTDPGGAAQAGDDLPVLVAEDPRAVLGAVASWVHGHPSHALTVLGVTGTNGKTTTAFLLDAGLRAAGHRTGLIGTVLTRVGDEEVPSRHTTPEATDLHALFAVMRERGVTAVAMEVSSHALALGRVDGVRFDTSVFTNLSQDHLDFHADMEDYFLAKASLFTPERSARGVVNADDAAGRRLLAAPVIPLVAYGEDAPFRAESVRSGPDGSAFELVGPGGAVAASVQLPGDFNVSNAVGALACLVTAGVPVLDAVRGVAELPGVPGRMERVDAGQPFTALVDYAHTPDAVRTLLRTVRAVTTGRVLVVLGCGGDRDRGKRPLMGRAAVEGADVAVLTSDNPRSEDPSAILAEMAQPGALVEPDRRAAIALAVAEARPGDTLVVAGKGHETGQDVAGVVTPFDDRLVLREALEARLRAPA